MPTYLYETLPEDGSPAQRFEVQQSIQDKPLEVDPESGRRVRRVLCPPFISSRHTPGKSKALLDNKRIEQAGFTKYEKDKGTGEYHRVAGKNGPITFKKPSL